MIRLMIFLAWAANPAFAQDFSALARVDAAKSQVSDLRGGLAVDLYLSQAVPYRVFTLDDPRRLVLDFREVDWRPAPVHRSMRSGRPWHRPIPPRMPLKL